MALLGENPRHLYYVYILTNPKKNRLYIGVTNNLGRRLTEHKGNKGSFKSYTGRNFCYQLVYYEEHKYILNAIAREKQIKRWNRRKKDVLIASKNPSWLFLNDNFINP